MDAMLRYELIRMIVGKLVLWERIADILEEMRCDTNWDDSEIDQMWRTCLHCCDIDQELLAALSLDAARDTGKGWGAKGKKGKTKAYGKSDRKRHE